MRKSIEAFEIGCRQGWKLFWSPFVGFVKAFRENWEENNRRRR